MTGFPTRRGFLWSAAGLALLPGTKGFAGSKVLDSEWDLSWLARLNGSARVVFDIPDLAGGAAISRAVRTIDEVAELLGVTRNDVAAVFVLRGFAVESAMGPVYWRDYAPPTAGLPEDRPLGASALERSLQSILPPDAPISMARYTIEGIAKAGGIVLVCDRAFQAIVQRVQVVEGSSVVAARLIGIRNLLAGTSLMPSGLSALVLAQRAGCSLITAEAR